MGKDKTASTNISIHFGDCIITNESDVSDLFNIYFSQKGIQLQQNISNLETLCRILMPTHYPLAHFALLIAPLLKLKCLVNFQNIAPLDKIAVTIYKK